ncbi:MAG TPA: UvrD-helicase domain-containing protein [Anaerolineae bacterium]|nr:UvrD-helicase domain-containing protein [Anaerolineae bacterium]
MAPIAPEHPIVAQMAPSAEQAPAILDRGRDVVVTAGAGAGKTLTLVARYLSLLAEGLPLRSIVAVTFTQKAAREMRNRVRQEIHRYLQEPGPDLPERERWQTVYRELDGARIDTIHGLCSEVLRSHPAEAGVDPNFQVLDEGHAAVAVAGVVEEALAWAAGDVAMGELFALLGERTLRATLTTMLARRLDVEACLGSAPAPVWPAWEAGFCSHIRGFFGPGVEALFKDLRAVRDDGTLARAQAAGDKLAPHLHTLLEVREEIDRCLAQGDWAGASARLPILRRSMPGNVGSAGTWRPHEPKPALGELRRWYEEQGPARWTGDGIDEAHERRLAEAVPALRVLFTYASDLYTTHKQERQALDFDDLEARALALLREDVSVRQRWQDEVQALLVDEFQDTNGRQRDLVLLLNGDQGRLFIVGDAKQSIYRFRGADVAVFRGERKRIEQGGAHLPLETSYRAHRDLIAALNALLRPVLGEGEDPGRPWAEPFAPLRHQREEAGPGLQAPFVELHLTVGPKSDDALRRAAVMLAARVRALVESGVQVEERGRLRPLGYGDVAVLCRASASFRDYEDAFEEAGVPFLSVAGGGFYGRAEVRDLLNALRAVADPTDDLAFAGLLRSPACGLSDAALLALCREREARQAGLWELLAEGEGLEALPEEERLRAGRAAGLAGRLHEMVGRAPVADVLKALLDETGYGAALIRAGQARGARNVSKLLAYAHASEIAGVGEFLEYVAGLREIGARESEARTTAEGAVQILTIHAAKGLEFPVVAIGDITHRRGGVRGLLLDPELGLLLPVPDPEGRPPAVYRLGSVREDEQERAESDRLLYVAATRARELLILSGCVSLKKGCVGRQDGWLGSLTGAEGLPLESLAVAHDPAGAAVHRFDLQVGTVPVSCALYEPQYGPTEGAVPTAERSYPPAVLPPPLLEPVLPGLDAVDGRVQQQETVPEQRVWRVVPHAKGRDAPAWVVGLLVHEALAAWRFPGAMPDAAGERSFERWVDARARGCGIADAGQLVDAAGRVRRLLLRFRAHPLFSEMDAAGQRLHEVPYSRAAGEQTESGIIDALYRSDGTWTVVEFKTDRVKDRTELARLLAEGDYPAQAGRYAAAVEALLGQKPRCAICWLDVGGSVLLTVPDGGVEP